MTLPRRFALLGIAALFALQFYWHAFLLPPGRFSPWFAAALFAVPILPAVILALLRHPHAAFWGSVAALGYFCHGVMEAWTDAQARPLALTEAALSVWVIVTASWAGMRARFARKA